MNTPINDRQTWIEHNAEDKLRAFSVMVGQWVPSIMSLNSTLENSKPLPAHKARRLIQYIDLALSSLDDLIISLENIRRGLER